MPRNSKNEFVNGNALYDSWRSVTPILTTLVFVCSCWFLCIAVGENPTREKCDQLCNCVNIHQHLQGRSEPLFCCRNWAVKTFSRKTFLKNFSFIFKTSPVSWHRAYDLSSFHKQTCKKLNKGAVDEHNAIVMSETVKSYAPLTLTCPTSITRSKHLFLFIFRLCCYSSQEFSLRDCFLYLRCFCVNAQ